MNYVSTAWEFVADSHLLKFQRLQNNFLRSTGTLLKRVPTRDFHVAFKIPYIYNFVKKNYAGSRKKS
jgi:hypothetical protein